MGYRFRDSGYPGIDVVITTEAGTRDGKLPKGVIIPAGYMHIDSIRTAFMALSLSEGFRVYVAKHCDKEDEVTHIDPGGSVNRFGLFITRQKMPGDDWRLEISDWRWLSRRTVPEIREIVKYL